MNYVIVSVRDRAADVFTPPMFVPSLGVAMRSFSDEVNRADEKNMLYQHPEDFDLYQFGTYDDGVGKFDLLESPRQVCIGKDVVRKGGA